MEQSTPSLKLSQTNKIIEVATYNVHSINKVLVQQILETIGQITRKTLDRNPQQVMKLKPMILRTIQTTHMLLIQSGSWGKDKDWTNLHTSQSMTFGYKNLGWCLEGLWPKHNQNALKFDGQVSYKRYEARKYPWGYYKTGWSSTCTIASPHTHTLNIIQKALHVYMIGLDIWTMQVGKHKLLIQIDMEELFSEHVLWLHMDLLSW